MPCYHIHHEELKNAIALGKAVIALIKVIQGIKGDDNKVKIYPCKRKKTNIDIIKYIKGGEYSKAEIGK